jgi:flagellar hook protein FlgE
MGFDSLYTGISGLDAFQSQIDLISNNIANSGTVGFKGQTMNFTDAFYQMQQAGSAPTQTNGGTNGQFMGLGVRIGSVDSNFAQGGLETTGVNTNLAINGDGFFILNNTNGSGQPTYTRNGSFSINQQGVLYDPASGLAVMGYMANSNGTVTSIGSPTAITLPLGLADQATATGAATAVKIGPTSDKNFDMSLGGSLDQSQFTAESNTPGSGQPKVLSTTIYDSLGNAHQATITFTPVATNSAGGPYPAMPLTVNDGSGNPQTAATRWQYSISFADGTTPTTNTGYVFFDSNGQYINSSSSATGTPVHALGTAPSAADGNSLQIAATGWPAGDNAAASNIGIDFSNMTCLSGTASANVLQQNGFAPGILSNISVGQDGTITGSFTNGQQKTLARVAMATFQNEDGLARVSGGFQQTASSGLAQLGQANVGRFGAIVDGALEQSNVSLADEFTKLITAQRAFEANSRGITTADQNLIDLVNLRASEN